jgi:hypothetical protein
MLAVMSPLHRPLAQQVQRLFVQVDMLPMQSVTRVDSADTLKVLKSKSKDASTKATKMKPVKAVSLYSLKLFGQC